jgi:hypothetical protein
MGIQYSDSEAVFQLLTSLPASGTWATFSQITLSAITDGTTPQASLAPILSVLSRSERTLTIWLTASKMGVAWLACGLICLICLNLR